MFVKEKYTAPEAEELFFLEKLMTNNASRLSKGEDGEDGLEWDW